MSKNSKLSDQNLRLERREDEHFYIVRGETEIRASLIELYNLALNLIKVAPLSMRAKMSAQISQSIMKSIG